MTINAAHVRQGHGTVRPYLYGPIELPEFVRQVFDAIELERFEFGPKSFHVEMQIGDSTVVIEAGELPSDVKPWLGSVYVYVADVDAVHSRALSLGARLLAPVVDKPYQERQGGLYRRSREHLVGCYLYAVAHGKDGAWLLRHREQQL